MITYSLALLLVILSCGQVAVPLASGDIVESADHQRFSLKAYVAGRLAAERDIGENRLSPWPPWLSECAPLLEQRYGIHLKDIAGCVVDDQIIGHVIGYNDVSMAEMKRRFGRDVLE